jgi:ornithine cyclodeaminase
MAFTQTPFVSAEQINALCSYDQIVENQRQAFKNFYLDEAVMGQRAILSQGENAQFSYIARASKNGPTTVKFGTVVPSNAGRDISVVQTTVSVIDALTGSIKLFLDGEAVTKWRTVCASMAAAKELANPVKKIAVIGMGHQGTAHAIAAKEIFKPERIIGIDRDIKNGKSGIDLTQNIEAAYGCDLIFICTNSQEPVINSALNSGTTCISIGSFAPNRLEVAVEALSKADKVFGDDAKTISEQSGSVVKTLINVERNWDQAHSIGGVYAGKITGRENKEQVIYYFSVGLGIQDAALAEFILANGKF